MKYGNKAKINRRIKKHILLTEKIHNRTYLDMLRNTYGDNIFVYFPGRLNFPYIPQYVPKRKTI